MTYKSTHPPGAKTILLALGLLLGPLVAACSGGIAATAEGDSTPTTSSTPSFAPVDFDKDAPGFVFFNACREFTDQDYSDLALELKYDPVLEADLVNPLQDILGMLLAKSAHESLFERHTLRGQTSIPVERMEVDVERVR